MSRSGVAALLLPVLGLFAPPLGAQRSPTSPLHAELQETIDVVSRSPGPPLWRVSAEAATLWVVGVPALVPSDLSRQLDSVAAALSVSQRYLLPPELVSKVSKPLTALGTLRRVKRLEKNPDGRRLEDVLPRDRYFLFSRIRSRYSPLKGYEKLRPYAAAEQLYEHAVASEGLVKPAEVLATLERTARKAGAEVVRTSVPVPPQELLEALGAISPAEDLGCFDRTLAQLDRQLDEHAARARAWARGESVPPSRYTDPREPCGATGERFLSLWARRDEAWLAAAEAALAETRVSVAALPLSEIDRPEGLLTRLVARGYQLEPPR